MDGSRLISPFWRRFPGPPRQVADIAPFPGTGFPLARFPSTLSFARIFPAFLFAAIALPFSGRSQQDSLSGWSYHFQITTVIQGHPAFRAAYSGTNSLRDSGETAISLTSTLFFGRRLWNGAAFYLDPEIAGGTGLSSTLGIAAFPNGETFRIGDPKPQLYFGRAFIRQHIALAHRRIDTLGDGDNQISEEVSSDRLDITLGKLALSDLLDDNEVSHDPRTDFLNWGFMNNGAWDYAANTRGYTYLLALELIHPGWALRLAEALEPVYANGPTLNFNLTRTQSENLELDKEIHIGSNPGHFRLLGYLNNNEGPGYQQVLDEKKTGTDTTLDVVHGKTYGHIKYGGGLNIDQQFSPAVSAFLRAGWNDGKTATWAFANIDETLAGGIRISGAGWKRPKDQIGLAGLVDGISSIHRAFLNGGGYDFMIGDGKLTRYGPETILECYYQTCFLQSLFLTADYQFVAHPAYNLDRGPVQIFSLRTHVEF